MPTIDDMQIPWLPDTADELRFRVTLLLAPIYMTTSTATLPDTVLADARNDSNRLKAAVDAVIAIMPKPAG